VREHQITGKTSTEKCDGDLPDVISNFYAGDPIYLSDQINVTGNVICQGILSPEHGSMALEIATNGAAVGRNTVAHQKDYLKDGTCCEKAWGPAAETAKVAKGGKMGEAGVLLG
uniref:Uncharacterized protein n=1 Tax=Romanomermis culicivorax TaxID=13658 RepID=A0A915L781_ROMCU